MTTSSARKYFVAHNACLNSAYDLNVVKEALRRGGHEIVSDPRDADEVVFSGCSVREAWVEDAAAQLREIKSVKPSASITVTGCAANTAKDRLQSLVGPSVRFESHDNLSMNATGMRLHEVDKLLVQTSVTNFEGSLSDGLSRIRLRVGPLKANVLSELQKVDRLYGSSLEDIYRRTTKGFVFYHEALPAEFITITRSCQYRCSFCTIPVGRGPFRSVPLTDVVSKARDALAKGTTRLVLLGDEIGNYGSEAGGPKLVELLTTLTSLDASVRLSLRYIEPTPFLRNFETIRHLCEAGRIDLLYVSLQSGSPRVLKRMNRNHDLERVTTALELIRRNTDTVLYSNWMVGFPEESPADFEETCRLVDRLQMHINIPIPFSARPGTPASVMSDQLHEAEIELRAQRLAQRCASIKGDHMARCMSFLPFAEMEALREKIVNAELVQYNDSTAHQPSPTRLSLPVI